MQKKDACNTLEGVFEILTKRFRPQFNERIKSLQFCMLSRQDGENAEEWMGRLWLLAIECSYKEPDKQLKGQFIHSLNDTDMLGEIIQELTKIHENTEITCENVLSWAKRVDTQIVQSAKEFDKLKVVRNSYKGSIRGPTQTKMTTEHMCRYCGSSY